MKDINKKVIINWSGGKDATMALYEYLKDHDLQSIHSLSTTINENLQRITMHGVPVSLLKTQSEALGIKVFTTGLPEDISMNKYSEIMHSKALSDYNAGIKTYIYGDINLEDLREFRDKELSRSKIKATYPLWGKNTKDLAEQFINAGFKAIVVATSSKLLDETFVGREFDHKFLADLPKIVDPCGENGEFHTFVYDGPIFNAPVRFIKGKKTYKTYEPKQEDAECFCCEKDSDNTWDKGFWFCDLQST